MVKNEKKRSRVILQVANWWQTETSFNKDSTASNDRHGSFIDGGEVVFLGFEILGEMDMWVEEIKERWKNEDELVKLIFKIDKDDKVDEDMSILDQESDSLKRKMMMLRGG